MGYGSSLAGCIQSQGVRVPNSGVNVCQKIEISDQYYVLDINAQNRA